MKFFLLGIIIMILSRYSAMEFLFVPGVILVSFSFVNLLEYLMTSRVKQEEVKEEDKLSKDDTEKHTSYLSTVEDEEDNDENDYNEEDEKSLGDRYFNAMYNPTSLDYHSWGSSLRDD